MVARDPVEDVVRGEHHQVHRRETHPARNAPLRNVVEAEQHREDGEEGVRDHREFADAARRLDVAQGEGREYAGDDHSSLHSHLFFVTELAHGFFGQGS